VGKKRQLTRLTKLVKIINLGYAIKMVMGIKKLLFILLVFGILTIFPLLSSAHANILINLDLDFDPEAKQKIITTAQEYLQTGLQPIGFDYDSELIVVKFNEYPSLSVSINPFDYSVSGVEESAKATDSGTVKTTEEQRKESADKIFEQLPVKYKEELKYGEEREERNLFTHTWYRYVDNVVVPKERLEVVIDGETGEVVSWRLQIFQISKELIESSPSITADVAQKVGELTYEGTPLDFSPVLIIHDAKPVWITRMKVLYPIYVGVGAMDGEIMFTGGMKGILPDKYSASPPIVESSLIKKIYGETK
jgi:hypothetical protein